MYYKFRLAVELATKHIIVLFVTILKQSRGLLGFCCGSDLMPSSPVSQRKEAECYTTVD